MHSSLKYILGALSIAILVSPLWARTDQMELTIDHPLMIGTTKVDPGEYQVKADEDKESIDILRGGIHVATAQGHWVKLPKKADNSEASYDASRLVEVQFQGSAQSFQLNK